MWNKLLASPYLLALLVGIHPISFYLSNNWYIFPAYRNLLILGTFAFLIFLPLATCYFCLSRVFRKRSPSNPPGLFRQLYVLGTILIWTYLLRATFEEFSGNGFFIALAIAFITLGMGWISPKTQILHLNTILFTLCIVNLGNGLYLMQQTTELTSFIGKGEDHLRQQRYDRVKFQKRPNVYYLVPDGYPNQKGLQEIFGLDDGSLYQHLESLDFNIYHAALSNYSHTLSSLSSTLGMQHHYYQGSIGNSELLHSREFVVSDKNPVVRVFRANDYQVHYVHEKNMMFAKGCFIDFCAPHIFMGDYLDILFSPTLQNLPFIRRVVDRFHNQSIEQIKTHIDKISVQPNNYFTYIHLSSPSHSPTSQQTPDKLASFREKFPKKIGVANKKITTVIERILSRDPQALIIINADHGGWGMGAYNWAGPKIFEGVPEKLITLDHLGVLLAIRWPEKTVPEYGRDIRTNINLFRHIFAYLSESQEILTTQVPDDGFLTKGKGKEGMVMNAVHDGKILEHMIEIGPLK